MFSTKKCDFGYLKAHLKKEIIISFILFGMSIGVLLLGIHLYGSKKNLLTLVAVLGLLPAGKELVNVIMTGKALKYACPLEHFNNVKKAVGEAVLKVRYDLYMTTYDKCYPIYSMTVFDDCIIGYTDQKLDDDKFDAHIKKMLSQNGFKVSNVKIFNQESKYLERIKNFAASDNVQSKRELEILHLMENLSL